MMGGFYFSGGGDMGKMWDNRQQDAKGYRDVFEDQAGVRRYRRRR